MPTRYKADSVQIISNAVMILLVAFILAPFAILVVSSFTPNDALLRDGYQLIPRRLSLEAYEYLASQAGVIGRAFGVTILVTAIGTLANLAITSMLAYPLSKQGIPGGRLLIVLVALPLLFNGGLVPTYILYAKYLGLKNTLLALIVPNLLMNGFNVLLVRNFITTSIPVSMIEAATIDGAGEFAIFRRVILPLLKPIMATIGLMAGIFYWNDWFNGLIYLNKPELFSIQLILNQMLADLQFLSNNANVSSAAAEAASKIPGTSVRMAIAVIGALPMFLAYPFFQSYFVKGISLGAVKG